MKKLIAGLLFFAASLVGAQTFPVNNLQVNGQVGGNACYEVPNVATLKSTVRMTGNVKNVCTQGYYAPGDAGEGQYYVVSTTSSGYTDNGGTILIALDGTVWGLVPSGRVNVHQFGARGDGSDDSAALQKAIVALSYVEFLPRTYGISTQLTGKSNITFGCSVPRKCTLKALTEIESLVYFQDSSNVVVSDLVLDGNNNTISNLRFRAQTTPYNVKITNNEITGTKADPTLFYGGIEVTEVAGYPSARYKNIEIAGNYIHDLGTHGGVVAYADKIAFNNNVLTNIGQHGFEAVSSSHVVQSGNLIDTCGTVGPGGSALGVGSHTTNYTITANTINNCRGDAPITLEFTSNYGVVSSNVIYNSYANAGINVSFGSLAGNVYPFDAIRDIAVVNNFVHNKPGVSTSTTAIGINVYSGSVQGSGITVSGNILDGFNVGVALQYLANSSADDNAILNMTGTSSIGVNTVWLTQSSVSGNRVNSVTGDHSFKASCYGANCPDQLNFTNNQAVGSGSGATKALVYLEGGGSHTVNGNKTSGSSNYTLTAVGSPLVSMMGNIGPLASTPFAGTGTLLAAVGNGNSANDFLVLGGSRIFYGSAPPTSGSYVRGDQVINTAPAVGSPKGWTNTVSGSPGTWVSQGNL